MYVCLQTHLKRHSGEKYATSALISGASSTGSYSADGQPLRVPASQIQQRKVQHCLFPLCSVSTVDQGLDKDLDIDVDDNDNYGDDDDD